MDYKIAVVISPNWRDYAKKYLKECMESIRAQDYQGEFKVYITDNETSPESYRLLRKLAPEAELVLNKNNDGFAKGCNDSIRLALQDSPEFIFIVNMDTVLDSSCISKIVECAENNPEAALLQARVMLHDKKDHINSLGNNTHFLGFGYCEGYNDKWSEKNNFKKEIMYPSGSAFLFRVSAIENIGLFDENLWMYNEDQDLGWKSLLAGYKNILCPDSIIYHKYHFAKSIKQYYWMDRNRLLELFKCYRLATIILVLPALLLMEIGLFLFSLKNGWFKKKLEVWKFFLLPSTWSYINKERKLISSIRKVGDKEILKIMSGRIWYQEVDDWKLRLVNPFFNLYFKFLKLIVWW